MSSASNHKKRSRRGYKMTRSFLAPKNSPLIITGTDYNRFNRGLLSYLMKRMTGGYERTTNT